MNTDPPEILSPGMKAVYLARSWLAGLFPDAETKARQALEKRLRKEAEYFAYVIRAKLTQLGICYRYPKSRKDFMASQVQELRFINAVGTPEAIYLRIDAMRLPRGVYLSSLGTDEVLQDLSVVCKRPVRFRHSVKGGAWYVIERASGAWGVPRLLKWGDVVETWPRSSRKKLLVPMGIGENRRLVYRSLAEFPHALVGGATGAGKTTLLHGWACALLTHNSPDDLRMSFIDLKGGVEFVRYKNLPHVIGPDLVGDGDQDDGPPITGFVKLPGDVVPLLEFLRREMDARLARFERAGGIQNIDIWNYRRRGDKLPRLVLFVDELASLMLDKSLKKKVEPLLADLTARGRAPGVHVVVSTQRPEVQVVSGLIKGNIDVRCAFRVPDDASSRVILDTAEAARFDDSTPLGRFIYRRGIEKEELQAPFITLGQMTELVRSVQEGRADDSGMSRIAPEDIFRLSVQQLEGNFSYRTLYGVLGGQVSEAYLRRLGEEYEGEVVEIDGDLYELHPSAGNRPRRFVLADEVGSDENTCRTPHTAQTEGDEIPLLEAEIVNKESS